MKRKDVRAKKFLGQHFLKNLSIAQDIAEQVSPERKNVLEIGPGTAVLTEFLLKRENTHLKLVEIDRESIAYLKENFPQFGEDLIEGDFLKKDMNECFSEKFTIAGNFPYNISSQIFFKVLDNRDQVEEVVCMLQKEVAERICEKPGSKKYGILSVLLQAFYTAEYCFTVDASAFVPPPKVQSGVIKLVRNEREKLDCNEKDFIRVVKQGFNNRRKTLRNALKSLGVDKELLQGDIFGKRAEQLSVEQFVSITNHIYQA